MLNPRKLTSDRRDRADRRQKRDDTEKPVPNFSYRQPLKAHEASSSEMDVKGAMSVIARG